MNYYSGDEFWVGVKILKHEGSAYFSQTLIPFIEEAIQQSWIEHYFLHRSLEQGLDLAFSVRGADQVAPLRQQIVAKLGKQRTEDTLQFIELKPHYEYYGGAEINAITKRFFQEVAQLYIDFAAQNATVSYGMILGEILKLQMAFAYTVTDTPQALLELLAYSFWQRVREIHFPNASPLVINPHKFNYEQFVAGFQTNYENQAAGIDKLIAGVLTGLANRDEFESDSLNLFLANCQAINRALIEKESQLDWGETEEEILGPEVVHPQLGSKPKVCVAYASMANKIWGISPHDEAYIAFVLLLSAARHFGVDQYERHFLATIQAAEPIVHQ